MCAATEPGRDLVQRPQHYSAKYVAYCKMHRRLEDHPRSQRLMQRHFAAISIQAAVRGLLCRQSWQVLRVATARVQAVYRGSLARRRFLQMKTAVTCIQAAFRSHCLRLQFLQMRTAATTIQAAYRGHRSRKELPVPKDAITPAAAVHDKVSSCLHRDTGHRLGFIAHLIAWCSAMRCDCHVTSAWSALS